MRVHVQGALAIVMLLYLLWGLAVLVAPQTAHELLSTGPYDPASLCMFGAALFAFATLFMIAAHMPARDIVHAAAVGLAFLGLTAAYLMFIARTMPASAPTVISLAINVTVALYLLISLTEAATQIGVAASGPQVRRKKTITSTRRRR